MALTLTKVQHRIGLNSRIHVYDVTFDSSYPTGGEAVAASDFKLDSIDAIFPTFSGATAANGRIVTFDPTNSKLLVWTGVATEAANASDQSAVTARVIVVGPRGGGHV